MAELGATVGRVAMALEALILTRTLYSEPDARAKFSAKVAELSGRRTSSRARSCWPSASRKELTPDSLYPFAQVALVMLANTLRRDRGVIVEVVGIPSDS
ncbi:hypothetical protein HTZ77_40160 [Nonomuraea sp. SMC257]|uniref:Uncharacterized protein n=1 Tax=Nonomuraea montanisoli TaxID=2741721 RepID=A0A7Y6IG27_9ACTN|nr:hypothetical protein [Nonomuraea montanisoli]NUW37574.1 hypothetical protein [Nonomuraea montanisoli]